MTAHIRAHGVELEITLQHLIMRPTVLLAALGQEARSLDIAEITTAELSEQATAFQHGTVRIHSTQGTITELTFSPGTAQRQQRFLDLLHQAQMGSLPDEHPDPEPEPQEEPQQEEEHELNFAALDVETANSDWGSICQIGVAIVRAGVVVDKRSWLCQPPASLSYFDPMNTAIHHITAETVVDEPPFAQVLGEVVEYIGDLIVIAHNAQFDMTALRRAAQAAGAPIPTLAFGCSLTLSRAAHLGVENHKLPTLAQFFQIDFHDHHDACADALACAEIVLGIAQKAHYEGSIRGLYEHFHFNLGSLNADRVYPVLKQPSAYITDDATNNAHSADDSTAGSRVGKEKHENNSRHNRNKWEKAATPENIPQPNEHADPQAPLFGQCITLTGDFSPFDKAVLWEKIAYQGGIIAKNVTKKTTLLAIGAWESITTKQKRAEELIGKGQDITMWTSRELFDALGLDPTQIEEEQPPF
ncbi:DNA polymerase III subunit epsilon [Corynebacterium sp. sy017]|uniref:exonuclease domain-containing protein n=1 Tax=unclassified Corynebacterium TaxID=2624378 RepID=UPI001185CD5A|nr:MULTISPECIES: exonuclease domain-containing protein [unclassified Corynebacterium]MBP3087931.1 DNA polymerase III subunit epsilon [Corynebacterium sp. sy017]TSD92468.1 DNA polymerase III subunit epsilon [Corynebacterium sp. SY003]